MLGSRTLLLCLALALAPVAVLAEEFALKDLDGKLHRLSDYRGKWVIVNYWATWCPPCLEEIPELIDFHDRHKDTDAVVLGVNFEDISEQELREFIDGFLVSYPILPQEPGPRTHFGPLRGLPTTYIISPDGQLAKQHLGGLDGDMLEEMIRQ